AVASLRSASPQSRARMHRLRSRLPPATPGDTSAACPGRAPCLRARGATYSSTASLAVPAWSHEDSGGCIMTTGEASRPELLAADRSSLPRLQPLQHRDQRYAERARQVRQVVDADGLLATLDLAEELA